MTTPRLSVDAEPSSVTVSPCRGARLEALANATGGIPVTFTCTSTELLSLSASVTVNWKVNVSTVFGATKVGDSRVVSLITTLVPAVWVHA